MTEGKLRKGKARLTVQLAARTSRSGGSRVVPKETWLLLFDGNGYITLNEDNHKVSWRREEREQKGLRGYK